MIHALQVYKRSVDSEQFWDDPEPAGDGEVPFVLRLVDDRAGHQLTGGRRRREIGRVDHIAGQSPREVREMTDSGGGTRGRRSLGKEVREECSLRRVRRSILDSCRLEV